MASIISHPAVPLALAVGLGSGIISKRLLAGGVLCSIAPDLDVYAERLSSSIGHRGLTHSAAFALCCGGAAALFCSFLRSRAATAFWFVAVSTLSHGLLDACTNGGAGISLFWPLRSEGYFMPWRVIEVSPLGIAPFFSERGVAVLASEAKWVWAPAMLLAMVLYLIRRIHAKPAAPPPAGGRLRRSAPAVPD